MRWRTGNNRKLGRQRRRTAFNRAVKPWAKMVGKILARSLQCEARPWFRLEVTDDGRRLFNAR